MTRAQIAIDPATDQIEVSLSIDLTRLIGDSERYHALSTQSPEETAAEEFHIVAALSEKMQLLSGGEVLGWENTAFHWPDLPLEKFTEPWAAPMADLRFQAMLPEDTHSLRLTTSVGLAIEYPLVVTLKLESEEPTSLTRWLEPGQSSPTLAFVREPATILPALATTPATENPATDTSDELTPTAPDGTVEVARRYLVLGFEHILPLGVDHILFVLGLFFLSHRWRPLLLQVSIFTLAHTLTLALTAVGILPYFPDIVEPLIAASIAYVGLENLWRTELRRSRVFVIFAFGLIHGMGFAGMLNAIGLPTQEFFTALIAFNVGVELGQLTVLGLAFLACAAFLERAFYRRWIQIPASLAISAIALFWLYQRTLG